MKNLLTLFISDKQYIEILSTKDKEEIHHFDEITILLYQNGKVFVLFEDFICEGIKTLYNALKKAIESKLQLDNNLIEKGIGYTWNNICFNTDNVLNQDLENIISNYSLWSTTNKYGYETWIYNIGEKIYFEISPTYKWFYIDPKESDEYVEFNQFISNYDVLDIFSVEMHIAKKWLLESYNLLEQMR